MADNLDALIEKEGAETIAAMIAEPVQGAGGVILPPEGYFDAIGRVLDTLRHSADRRRSDHRLRPHRQLVRLRDIRLPARRRMTIAKALSSAYLPISAVMISPEI